MPVNVAAETPDYDLAVIGGGVNGCGIARDAVGRGARVILLEAGDLAGATSSASTKLIHGGLRYLEQREFRLVHEALAERTVLWKASPHLTHELRFVLPHHRGLRPFWMLRLGLAIYDHLGGRGGLKGAEALDLRRHPAGAALKDVYRRGFIYSDCQTDDARLVVLNALDARERGADVRPRTRLTSGVRDRGLWRLEAEAADGRGLRFTAGAVVNAAGPWVNVVNELLGVPAPLGVRLVQGSHIVTRRLFDHDDAYIFQNADGRIVFAIPWEGAFTMIGTTDRDFRGDPAEVRADADEIAYLCRSVDEYLRRRIAPDDVVYAWSGVRALADDGASEARQATRDYVLKLDAGPDGAPLLSVYGGKITTYRRLAEAALARLRGRVKAADAAPWTAGAALPGGDFPRTGLAALAARIREAHPVVDEALAARLARSYGTRAFRVLKGVRREEDLGEIFTGDLTRREVDYLMDEEWAVTAEDVLERRTKLVLTAGPEAAERLDAYMAARRAEKSRGDGRVVDLASRRQSA